MTQKKPTNITGGRVVGQSEIEAGGGAYTTRTYEPDNFYMSATDRHHNKSSAKIAEKQTIAMPPFIVAMISELVGDDGTPYRTAYDFLRDAAVHRVHYLQERREEKPRAWSSFQRMVELERVQNESSRQREFVDRAREIIQAALQGNDMVLLRDAIQEARDLAPTLRSPYKDELQEYLNGIQNIGRIEPRSNKS